ncbi:YqaA family protein [Arenimonas sp. MALMAid1274]|uniref:YqaA family protein n=1 Tax=Arenimonas sp. MALMAid1274 TaxID=3411630 RepID=UPI003BA04181
MEVFKPLYLKALHWSRHRHAPALLTGLSFIEAIFFPVPPEMMLAPMSLAQPKRAMWFATLSLAGSMVGMFIGYALGYYAVEMAMPLVESLGYADQFESIKQQAAENGFWLLLIAGFTPIPFKIFTIASGAVGMPLLPFFFGALIGRGKRVYLVAGAIRLGGARAEAALHRYIEPIGWFALALLVAVVAWLFLRGQGA